LFPGIAVAEALLDIDPTSKVLFVGTTRGIEATAVPKAGFEVRFVDVAGLKRVGLKKALQTLVALPKSLLQSRTILREFGADAVLGVGGYASGPVVLAARSMGIATAICEQNSVPGVTNQWLGRVVRRVYGTFGASSSHFPKDRFVLVGNPVRKSFLDAAKRPAPDVERGLVFCFGGSQGARPLNECVPQALGVLQARGVSVHALHQAGKTDVDDVRARYDSAHVPASVTPFIDDMVSAYRKAHVVLCRAGATSCAELTALGVPAIVVPFPQAADDHQSMNAADLAAQNAVVVLKQSDMTPTTLADAIERLLVDDAARMALCEHAKRAGRLQAGHVIAAEALAGFTSSPRARTGAA
jgi:UDP-N-acetylglucosamine--N-acetylmuramyl-(pentapeptide) pyrophosphoryl-undecaprenol N-acetylglucosamine transferase